MEKHGRLIFSMSSEIPFITNCIPPFDKNAIKNLVSFIFGISEIGRGKNHGSEYFDVYHFSSLSVYNLCFCDLT